MRVRIIEVIDNKVTHSKIIQPSGLKLPTITDGWRFNFRKHSKKAVCQTYVLVTDETPEVIEGCLIFELKDTVEPYMTYIEIAPHNKGESKKYDNVAACLIAYACRLSFIHGKEHYKGWLAFDVLEEKKQDEIKLMAVYCQKYGALRLGKTTTMIIAPEAGENLITRFLN